MSDLKVWHRCYHTANSFLDSAGPTGHTGSIGEIGSTGDTSLTGESV